MSSTMRISATPQHEAHRETNSLRDVILGGQDGLVNILGVVLGVIAAGGSRSVLLATGSSSRRSRTRNCGFRPVPACVELS